MTMDAEPAGRAIPNLVLVVDDDVFFRESIAAFLKRHNYATLEAADLHSAYELAIQNRPSLAIVDIVLPPAPHEPPLATRNVGIELVRRLKQQDARMGAVLFSAYGNRSRAVLQLAVEGVHGLAYIMKGYRSGRVELLQALEEVRAGHIMIRVDELDETAQLADRLWKRLTLEERELVGRAVVLFPTLSDRECDVARALAHGQTVEAAGTMLSISARTVEKHINHIYSKLELDRADAFDPSLRKSLLLAKAVWLLDMLESEEGE